MSRSNLLQFLPDFSDGIPAPRTTSGSGFEPLVKAVVSQSGFTPIDVTACFTGQGSSDGEQTAILPDVVGATGDAGALAHEPDRLEPVDPELDILSGFENPVVDLSASQTGAHTGVESIALTTDELQPAEPSDNGSQAAIRNAMEASHAAELRDMEEAHAVALQALVTTALPKIRDDLVNAVYDEISPLLSRHLRVAAADRMIGAMASEIEDMIGADGTIDIELHGPEAMISAVVERVPADGVRIKAVPADTIDLVAKIDKRAIATRLTEIDELLREAAP